MPTFVIVNETPSPSTPVKNPPLIFRRVRFSTFCHRRSHRTPIAPPASKRRKSRMQYPFSKSIRYAAMPVRIRSLLPPPRKRRQSKGIMENTNGSEAEKGTSQKANRTKANWVTEKGDGKGDITNIDGFWRRKGYRNMAGSGIRVPGNRLSATNICKSAMSPFPIPFPIHQRASLPNGSCQASSAAVSFCTISGCCWARSWRSPRSSWRS